MKHLLIWILMAVMATPALAYEKEVHYYLTYYLCRVRGYTRHQAHQLASADWSVDADIRTEPFQGLRILTPIGLDKLTLSAQDVRVRFHAFPRSAECWFREDAEEKAMVEQLQAYLWKQGHWSQEHPLTHNPGVFFHFHQDTFAHKSFRSILGHLTAGHSRDFLSFNCEQSKEMVKSVVAYLNQFRLNDLSELPIHEHGPECFEPLEQTLQQMYRINPSNYVDHDKASKKPLGVQNSTIEPLNFLKNYWILPGPEWGTPDAEKTCLLLESKLREDIPDFIDYSLNSDGYPTSRVNEYDLAKARPYDYLDGFWREDSGPTKFWGDRPYLEFWYATDIRKVSVRASRHSWEDCDPDLAYNPSDRSFTFVTTPPAEDVAKGAPTAPVWALQQVQGEVKWRMVVKLTDCPTRLDVEFYPGQFSWKGSKGKGTARVLPGKSGWGTPRKFRYRYRGSPEYNHKNPDRRGRVS